MITKTAKDEIQQYLRDQANLIGDCDKVFIVENEVEITKILKQANLLNIPVTICGNHTSLTGASLPSSGWVISTERLNKIIEINVKEKYVDLEPGVTLKDLQQILKSLNMFFPPDPTEDSCFIGGMLGTNASGARSFKYGAVREFVDHINVILPQGDSIFIKNDNAIDKNHFFLSVTENKVVKFDIPDSYVLPKVKNTVGYYLKPNMSPIDLFIGSEGTLGVITKLRLKLLLLPLTSISLVVFFRSVKESFIFLSDVRKLSRREFAENEDAKIQARAIEFFDERSLNLLRAKFSDIPSNAKAAYWIEQECSSEQEYNMLLDLWDSFFNNYIDKTEGIWLGMDESDRMRIKNMRHSLPIIINDIIASRGIRKLGTDIAVPEHRFQEFYEMTIMQMETAGIDYVAFGHFGDAHLHLNMLPSNRSEMDRGKEIYNYLCLEAIKTGGTFSAEHGVGKLKINYLKRMVGYNNFQFMKKVKYAFDPRNILGRGTLFTTDNKILGI